MLNFFLNKSAVLNIIYLKKRNKNNLELWLWRRKLKRWDGGADHKWTKPIKERRRCKAWSQLQWRSQIHVFISLYCNWEIKHPKGLRSLSTISVTGPLLSLILRLSTMHVLSFCNEQYSRLHLPFPPFPPFPLPLSLWILWFFVFYLGLMGTKFGNVCVPTGSWFSSAVLKWNGCFLCLSCENFSFLMV